MDSFILPWHRAPRLMLTCGELRCSLIIRTDYQNFFALWVRFLYLSVVTVKVVPGSDTLDVWQFRIVNKGKLEELDQRNLLS